MSTTERKIRATKKIVGLQPPKRAICLSEKNQKKKINSKTESKYHKNRENHALYRVPAFSGKDPTLLVSLATGNFLTFKNPPSKKIPPQLKAPCPTKLSRKTFLRTDQPRGFVVNT